MGKWPTHPGRLHLRNSARLFCRRPLHNVEACRAARLALLHRWGTGLGGPSLFTERQSLEGPEATPKIYGSGIRWGGEPKPAVKGNAFGAWLVSQGRPARRRPGRFFFASRAIPALFRAKS